MAEIIAQDPNGEPSGLNVDAQSNSGRVFARLKPRKQRKLSADEIIDELRPKFAQVLDGRVFLTNPPALRIGGFYNRSPYAFTLPGPNPDELDHQPTILDNVLR